MVRVFSTNFEFQGKTYTTKVYLTMDESDFAIHISVPDPSLYYLLPEGKINYNSKKGLDLGVVEKKQQAQELVGNIVRSVEKQLHL